ncbi:MAG TPA: biotin-dependent carboxyltransferase family protein [Anaerolineales bacterium]|nr:biotin-dependent carboxyltransferase family protein [Anaerolineales bacterium]
MTLEVIEISGLATIQDSGRVGWRRFGVPASGPMDPFASRAANALVENPVEYAVLEIGLGDATFQARQDCLVAVTGMGYKLSSYIWEFPLWTSFFVRAGWKIHLNKTDTGMWAYLAVTGGIQTQPVLGSRSTYLRGGFGGLEGRQLQAGDIIPTGKLPLLPYELAARTFTEEARPDYQENPVIDVIMGPQTSYFRDESVELFLSSEYSISLTSDRMGYRLEGPTLIHRTKVELISEGMAYGAIQVPAGGQPIVMMPDGPPTGGYPKIGTVSSADLPLLAQCLPNKSRLRFRETTVDRAQEKYRQFMRNLQSSIVEAE